jgi:hypothetical protein
MHFGVLGVVPLDYPETTAMLLAPASSGTLLEPGLKPEGMRPVTLAPA